MKKQIIVLAVGAYIISACCSNLIAMEMPRRRTLTKREKKIASKEGFLPNDREAELFKGFLEEHGHDMEDCVNNQMRVLAIIVTNYLVGRHIAFWNTLLSKKNQIIKFVPDICKFLKENPSRRADQFIDEITGLAGALKEDASKKYKCIPKEMFDAITNVFNSDHKVKKFIDDTIAETNKDMLTLLLEA